MDEEIEICPHCGCDDLEDFGNGMQCTDCGVLVDEYATDSSED